MHSSQGMNYSPANLDELESKSLDDYFSLLLDPLMSKARTMTPFSVRNLKQTLQITLTFFYG